MIRAALQLSANAFAAGTLFVAIAASATNLSELPLKPSVLAKPNVIFGMDDSGSMDSEVMLYNNDGAMWWNFTNRNGWGIDAAHPNPSLRTLTTTWFNAAGNATAAWRKMIYLFPNGTGTGNRVYNDGANDHFAILPTSQFAFLRWSGIRKNADGSFSPAPSAPVDSPMHNPLYYNPLITYQPWAPARIGNMASDVFMDGAANDATPATTRSHPLNGITGTNYSGGTGTFNLSTTRAANQTANHVFTALPGMTIPAGSTKLVCDSNNGSGPGAGGCAAAWVAVAADEVVPANQVVWVAMEYRPATVWVREACTVDAAVSVGVADCAAIPSGGTLKRYEITSAGSYNWGSVSRTGTQELQNFANWFQFFRKRKLMLAAAMGDTLENLTGMRLGVAPFNALPGTVRLFDADATTNSTNRFRVSGEFYNANGSGGTPTRETLNHIGLQYQRTDTTDGGVIQFACQRNNAFIVTDGFANASGSPTLATLATTYYNTNPRPTLETGKVRPTPLDPNTNLHVNTYGLTLGARGTLFFGEDSVPPVNAGDWPVPNQNRNPTAVDDLWRATINGKGRMYLANTPEETASRVKAGLDDIRNEQGAQGGVAVSAVNLSRSDGKAYLGYYNPRGWVGDLEARDVDRETAQIKDTSRWRAEDRLTTLGWSNRKVYSATGGVGLDFTAANFGTLLTANAAERTAMVDYLRGNRSGEGQTWRLRYGLLGPVINSEPVISREDSSVIFLASSEGQLHAFDTTTGSEIWAFVPPGNWTDLAASTRRNWTFKTLLDATPVVAKADNGERLLIGGMGAAGRRWYALRVDSPRTRTPAELFKWSFPSDADATNLARMGYTVGKPAIVKQKGTNKTVVLVTSGYDNGLSIGDGKGRLWMLDAADGSVLKTWVTSNGTNAAEAGLTHVSALRELDGTTQFVYGGDLHGNVYRFDITTAGAGPHAPHLLTTLVNGAGSAQPITAIPELMTISGRTIVVIGTGRLLDVTDWGKDAAANINSIYAIADGTTIANVRTSLKSRTYTRNGNPDLTGATVDDWSTERGWYMDLPAGEHINTDPTIAYGAAVFIANSSGATNCAQSSWAYVIDITTGLPTPGQTNIASLISDRATASRAAVLVGTNGRGQITVQTSDRTIVQKNIDPPKSIAPGKNAWKEIRRSATR